MPEALIVAAALLGAGLFVLWPLIATPASPDPVIEDEDAAVIRHRVALEALRDVETDRRAGSLDAAAYELQRAEAEDRVAAAAVIGVARDRVPAVDGRARRAGLLAAAAAAAVLLAGSFTPATGIPNRTETNQSLVDAQAAEAARQDRIEELLVDLRDDPSNVAVVSELADAYLAGTSPDDLVRAAASLQLLIGLDPDRADAYERIMGAYLRAGDSANARAAYESYEALSVADPVEVAFFDGLIALRGEGDTERALAAFDRFLELAPDDPRGGMIRGLRDQAAATE
ncbi:MAG: hypothetical protein ABIW50_06015 [Candidatus Limnocylindria bacterium]